VVQGVRLLNGEVVRRESSRGQASYAAVCHGDAGEMVGFFCVGGEMEARIFVVRRWSNATGAGRGGYTLGEAVVEGGVALTRRLRFPGRMRKMQQRRDMAPAAVPMRSLHH
jgi:hypothetical protein